ncbi:MAG: hypothetical protein ACFNLJ_01820, partial [Selenomonas artemidis]
NEDTVEIIPGEKPALALEAKAILRDKGYTVHIIEENEPRGEFVIVVAGLDARAAEGGADAPDLAARYAAHLAAGLEKKEAMRRTAQELGIARRDVYKTLLEKKIGTHTTDQIGAVGSFGEKEEDG